MIDLNSMRYVGWNAEVGNGCIQTLFTPDVIRFISRKITENLEGVDPQRRKLIVPDESIISVLNSIYSSHRPRIGDIHSRYVIPDDNPNDVRQDVINRTIETITDQVRNDIEITENNSKLTKWTTLLGDFNVHGIRGHSEIKTKKRRINKMEFNMNY